MLVMFDYVQNGEYKNQSEKAAVLFVESCYISFHTKCSCCPGVSPPGTVTLETKPYHYGFLKCAAETALYKEKTAFYREREGCGVLYSPFQTLSNIAYVSDRLSSYTATKQLLEPHTLHTGGCSQFTQPDLGWSGKSHSNKCISAFPWSRSRDIWIKCKVGRKNGENVTDGGP